MDKKLSPQHVAALKACEPEIRKGYEEFLVDLLAGQGEDVPESLRPLTEAVESWTRTYARTSSGRRIISADNERFLLASTFFTLGAAVTMHWSGAEFVERARPGFDEITGY